LRVAAIPQPLKILVVVSNPSGEGEFDSERALAAIQEALDYSRRMGWVELDYLEEATFAHFQSRLAAFQPHVVHYIGHGGKNPPDAAAIQPPYSGKPGETYLAFANDDGEVAPLYGKALKRLLADTPSVQLLVLSGCMTGQTAFSDALAGAGTSLLRESHVAGLVVMQYSILVDTAIQFAKVFYEAIGRGESLSRGLTHVRQVLAQSRGEHRADWGIPALYLRSPELQLVDPRAPSTSLRVRSGVLSGVEGEGVSIGDLPVVAGFVGRTAELRQLRETVRHPQKPVIYIWGLGGIGKTSVTAKLIEKLEHEGAIEARRVIHCDQIEPTFAAVAEKLGSFISLQGKAGHADAGLVLQDSRYDIETRVSLLNKAIKERRYLIVFDNFESLFSERAPQIGRLTDASLQEFFMALFSAATAARSTFLFTCRYQWDLLTEEPGMNRFTCNLALDNCCLLHLQGLSPAQTRMLMKNLPALSKLTFNQQNQVLPLLLGHPHTIRLFDAYLKQYGIDAVLRDETIIGTGGRGGRPSAPTIIIEKLGEYFLDGLWSRLNEAEKDVLGLLSVFRTSLSEKALTQLITEPKALITVLNYSLLQRESGEDGPSYQVHPVVRGYVESKLSAEKMRIYHMRAVEFYVSQHEDILSQFKEIDIPKPELLAQIANLAAQRGQTQLAQTLTASLLEMHHHLFDIGESEQAFNIVDALKDFLLMARREIFKELLFKSIASVEGIRNYFAKGNLATLLQQEGKWQEALVTYQECIDYFESIGAKEQIAQTISQQAQIYQNRGEYKKALELELQARKIFEETKDEKNLAVNYYRIAQLLLFMNCHDEALAAGEQAMAKARAIKYQAGIAKCLHQLGLTFSALSRPQEAFARFQESLVIEEETCDRTGQADTLGEMGKILMFAGQFEDSINFLQRALAIYYELNAPVKVASALETIGYTFEQQGHFSEALKKYQEALRLMQQYSSPQHVIHMENHIARVKGKMKSQ